MVSSCCAHKCTTRHVKGSLISFHAFPSDVLLRKKWIIATKRDNFVPTKSTRICSKHFKDTDYVINFGRKTLIKDAVPSIFDIPKHLKRRVCTRKVKRSDDNDEINLQNKQMRFLSPSESIENKAELEQGPALLRFRKREPFHLSEFTEEDLKCPLKAKVLRLAKKVDEKQKELIKQLRNKTYRMKKQLKSLQDVIIHLKKSQRISEHCYSVLQVC